MLICELIEGVAESRDQRQDAVVRLEVAITTLRLPRRDDKTGSA